MPRPRYKSLARPDEIRSLPKTHADLVSLGDTTVTRAQFEEHRPTLYYNVETIS